MKRQITGLHAADRCAVDQIPDGVFLVRVQRAAVSPAGTEALLHDQLWPFSNPMQFAGQVISSRIYCTPKALWKLNWFLRDFGYDTELLGRDEVDDQQLVGLRGVVKISHIVINGTSLLRLRRIRPGRSMGRTFTRESGQLAGGLMTYSYTQISQYLTCPRRYRYRYLDGWKEKDTRAAMLFGRAFE